MSKKELEKPPLRVVGLVAENFKRLQAVEIKPTGDVVEIVGPNEAGKSSILDAIFAALGGEAAVPEMPIRKGEKEATIRVDLGEMVVIKTFKMREDGKTFTTRLRVENAEGFKASSPQTMIDGLLGKFTFDPLDFDRLKMKDKFEVMKGFVPDVDFAALAKADDTDRAERTVVNRDAKNLKAQIDAIVVPEDAPTEKVDEDALVAEIATVGQFNADIDTRADRRVQATNKVAELKTTASGKRAAAAALIQEAEGIEKEAADLQERLDNAEPLPDRKDVADLQMNLQAAKAKNALVDRLAQRAGLVKQHTDLEEKSAALTAQIDQRQADKVTKIKEAKLPVDGLEFGDGVILLNGIPLDQCSAAQRLRTSVAIAMAANPRLRVLRISEGSLLDKNGMKILADMCHGRGYQAWVEKVDDDAKTGFIIEEGRLRDAPQPAGEGEKEAA